VNCQNCDAALTGPYCAQCGQKSDTHQPTFGHFVGETAESLTHADSRLWRTLWLLISRPGFLTTEFFAGRRASYLPPIRLYIVLSVAFFLALALVPQSESPAESADKININADCKTLQYHGPLSHIVQNKLRDACLQVQRGDSGQLAKTFLANLPKAMWVMLPLFAFLMLAFWWRPRRFYAEHVLFLIHNHSAVFALLTVDLLASSFIPDSIGGWISVVICSYLLWYTWRGMRNFYGDSRGLALFKFSALALLYMFCAVLMLTLTGLAAVLVI